MDALTRDWLKTWAAYSAWLLALLFLGLLFFGASFSGFSTYFDAEHYQTIGTVGYAPWLTAFYPGFPFLWKAFGLTTFIGVVNALMAACGLAAIAAAWNMKPIEKALLVLAPLGGFWLLPYSEGLTTLALGAALAGLKLRNVRLVLLGMLIASFTRPLWPVLGTAWALVAWRSGREGDRTLAYAGLEGTVLGTFAALGVHRLYVGEWFTFHAAQEQWGNGLRMPHIPFSTWSGDVVMMADSAALMIGVVAGIVAVRGLWNRRSGVELLPWLYLAGMVAITLLFRGGELFSLGRFVWALPFAGLVLVEGLRRVQPAKRLGLWLLMIPAVALLCGAYLHVKSVLVYGPVFLVGASVVWVLAKPASPWRLRWLVLLAAGIQLAYWMRMCLGGWVG